MDIIFLYFLIVVILLFLAVRIFWKSFVIEIRVPDNQIGVLRISGGIWTRKAQNKIKHKNTSEDLVTSFHIKGVALNDGEIGIKPEVFLPGHFERKLQGLYEKYIIEYYPQTEVKEEEIALVFSKFGASQPVGRKLGLYVECNDFQDGQSFLLGGGQKGSQAHILREGVYYINPCLFKVIDSKNVKEESSTISPNDLRIIRISGDEHKIGIVITEDGKSLEDGIAAPIIKGSEEHNKFQNASKFILMGGYKGLQEEFLLPGTYFINPWFAKIKITDQVFIPNDYVGVISSSFGKTPANYTEAQQLSNNKEVLKANYEKLKSFLVQEGYRGILCEAKDGGQYHPINTSIYQVYLVPTNQIVLEWYDGEKTPPNRYDAELKAIPIFSKDRHELKLKVRQVIQISKVDAPVMILTVGAHGTDLGDGRITAIRNLVTRVLSSTISSAFLGAAAKNQGIDFIDDSRIEIQAEISQAVKSELKFHGVNGIDTTFEVVYLPDGLKSQINLMTTFDEQLLKIEKDNEIDIKQTELKIALEKQKLFGAHELEENRKAFEEKQLEMEKEIETKKLENKIALEKQQLLADQGIEVERKVFLAQQLEIEKEIEIKKLESKIELAKQQLLADQGIEEERKVFLAQQLEIEKEIEIKKLESKIELAKQQLLADQGIEEERKVFLAQQLEIEKEIEIKKLESKIELAKQQLLADQGLEENKKAFEETQIEIEKEIEIKKLENKMALAKQQLLADQGIEEERKVFLAQQLELEKEIEIKKLENRMALEEQQLLADQGLEKDRKSFLVEQLEIEKEIEYKKLESRISLAKQQLLADQGLEEERKTFLVQQLEIEKEIEGKKLESRISIEKQQLLADKELAEDRIASEEQQQAIKKLRAQGEADQLILAASRAWELEQKKLEFANKTNKEIEELKVEVFAKTIAAEGGPQARFLISLFKNIPKQDMPQYLNLSGNEIPDFLSNPIQMQFLQLLLQQAGHIIPNFPIPKSPEISESVPQDNESTTFPKEVN